VIPQKKRSAQAAQPASTANQTAETIDVLLEETHKRRMRILRVVSGPEKVDTFPVCENFVNVLFKYLEEMS